MQSLSEKCTNILQTPASAVAGKSTVDSNAGFYDERFVRSGGKFQDPLALKMNSLKIEMYPTPWSQIAASLAATATAADYTPQGLACLSSTSSSSSPAATACNESEENAENNGGGARSSNSSSSNSHRLNRKTRNRKSLRYMTQPITLIEIKETEEDCSFQVQPAPAPADVKPNAAERQDESEHQDESSDAAEALTSANTQLNARSYFEQMNHNARRHPNRKTIERSSKMRAELVD